MARGLRDQVVMRETEKEAPGKVLIVCPSLPLGRQYYRTGPHPMLP